MIGIKDINQSNRYYNAYWRGPNKEADEKSAYNNVQVGDGPQHREIGSVISTDNASWRGPNIENFEKKFYKQCKLAGPQQREFRKEILQAMQVGEGQQI
ncbi:TPA: hypothetical protein O9444_000724 [Staphylococcus aureus]|uniref:hypothetical protein n=1 Tax=Staphylococcus aureus TaxID=1280 RepID=UPI00113CFFA3|nr:hypothetical protein [Staphylococcus aureus]EGQ1573552.1 hypothetical protein [Staphylococcus aureus]EJX2039913.1 hypothetical protein [Staphylococcus aureus]MBA6026904.1 hypothetical protein [Staphylococcus aureus]MBG1031966.1 hypothetical protein [Staphylococcus aureus]MBG1090667.1 hypothetical protein [Staphylococcus aureus]